MCTTHARRLVLAALAALTFPGARLAAQDALPKPADVQSLVAHPQQVTLTGSDDAQQLIVTAALTQGALQDLTGDVKYEVADTKVARVTSGGRVVPLANGSTEIVVRFG